MSHPFPPFSFLNPDALSFCIWHVPYGQLADLYNISFRVTRVIFC
jgi:hypothetical protein